MKRLVRDFLVDIIREMDRLEEFTGDSSFEEFRDDEKTIYACVRSLEVIGEAVKHVPLEFRRKYEDVPWQEIAGMRDVLIHGYFGVNVEVIWKTVNENIPTVKPVFKKMLDELRE
jgi:uncharacterized protein with HEPN domain